MDKVHSGPVGASIPGGDGEGGAARRLKARRNLHDLLSGYRIHRGDVVTLVGERAGAICPMYRVRDARGQESDWAYHCFRDA